MKSKLVVKIAGVIAILALISGGYCFWLMTVPLSYDWVPVVLIGFVVAIGVFVTALITSFVFLVRLSVTSSTECFADRADHLTARPSRQ